MRLRKIPLLLFAIISAISSLEAQDLQAVGEIAAKEIRKVKADNTEKIYLQTNKTWYLPGETIWFKAFVVDSLNHHPSPKSKVLFADLANNNDSVLHALLLNGSTYRTGGDFTIPDSAVTGIYWVRVYSTNILNTNTENAGFAPIYIFNRQKPAPAISERGNISTLHGTKTILNLFPEGGSLISGADCMVAVKAHDENNRPLTVSGIIRDGRDTIVARFSTDSFGLGSFGFSPSWFGKYKVFIKTADGREDSAGILPKVNRYSAQHSVTARSETSLTARVMLEDSLYEDNYTTYILGISGDSLCFAGVGRGMYELNIPLAAFPPGTARLLLYDTGKQLISERDLYIRKNEVKVNVIPDKPAYTARETAKLDISIADASGRPQQALLSVSVMDSRFAPDDYDVFGDSLAAVSSTDADLLMITMQRKGVSRESETYPAFQPGDTALKLSGRILKNNQPFTGEVVSLLSKQDNILVLQDTSGDDGRFSFPLPDFNDGSEFTLQMNDASGGRNEIKITIDSFPFPTFSTPLVVKDRFRSRIDGLMRIQYTAVDSLLTDKNMLLPVHVESSGIKANRSNSASDIITADMLKSGGTNSVGDAVLRSGKFHLYNGFLMIGGPNGFTPTHNDEPRVFMDGIEMTIKSTGDPSEKSPVLAFLKTIPTNDVDYIKLLTGPEAAFYGVRGGHGVIEIHTAIRSNTRNRQGGGTAMSVFPRGFYLSQVSQSPDYNNAQARKSKIPDTRNTIYWNGDIITGTDGKTNVSFFTADLPATYLVTITGVTTTGLTFQKRIVINRQQD